MCNKHGYSYAVSNPLFEVWLLLHHTEPDERDKFYAVTDEHPYERTDYFSNRLKKLCAPLRGKHIQDTSQYNIKNVNQAVVRAKTLHKDKEDLAPKYFATTVYRLIEKILEMSQRDSLCTN